MLKILIVDDHPIIRFAVRTILEKVGHKIVGETENGFDAIRLTQEIQPDIILLDIGLPGLNGFEVIEHLRNLSDPPKILVITSQVSKNIVMRCQKAGINGFVAKTEDLPGLIEAIRVVGRGYSYFPRPDYMEKWPSGESAPVDANRLISQLSTREISVLTGLVSGLSNKEISIQLSLSEKTISTYKQRLKAKLNARSIIDLIDFARRNQLIE
ncbi:MULTISPECIES: response regulator transcription factor [unclassified Enterobacter]|jgi:two-component system response regulator EvgA|uniref:response regulator transcription factor n=1 Tax=unclassified Enterobacter TaxID=2608935 RepID=UPI0015CE223A|nr:MULTISPECIES: response regulator transcription factor [unclassified Enterobacter]MBB3306712.1 two-component system response regulator EvgA [Enterobacter sp. Sphag1F]NYI15963.1 two-component system response regulator EvgA [Enterobacter sp. Sphag71]